MKFFFQIFIICIFLSIQIDLYADALRLKIEGFEFYFLEPGKEHEKGLSTLKKFSELFLTELKKEAERLGIRSPQQATIFVASTTSLFQKFSGQPSYAAGFYSYESKRFVFQNPNLLSHRGILIPVLKHEICHFLSPETKPKNSIWLEEAYCESLYPSEQTPKLEKYDFPNDWKTWNTTMNRSYSSMREREKKSAYSKMYVFGSWLLDRKGEVWFRNALEFHDQEIERLYSQFLKDSKMK